MIIDFALAIVPIAWLIIALAGLKLPGHIACVSALLTSAVLAALHWHLETINIATAALEGILNALWPICLVVVAALFTYNLTVRTGAIETIKRMLSGISRDRRILALLIAWGFGNFMEGMAGFGTAVAIPASMLVGIGFNPIVAVVGCLVVNATPTAFGSVGVPTATLSTITSIDSLTLSAEIACMEALLTFVAPFFLVAICGGGVKALRGSFGITFLAALSFTAPWLITALFIGPELPNIIGAACSMACIIAYSRFAKNEVEAAYALPTVSESTCASPVNSTSPADAGNTQTDKITLGIGLRA
ncbi:MAG: L-lactate permease, partial [Eggerthellaceae bacterium]|nr:L-lactate permease [Eggerthellaceae bacterium]